jgi:hypothetical protein
MNEKKSIFSVKKELEHDFTNIMYQYINNGKTFITPHMDFAIKRNEASELVVLENNIVVKSITIS